MQISDFPVLVRLFSAPLRCGIVNEIVTSTYRSLAKEPCMTALRRRLIDDVPSAMNPRTRPRKRREIGRDRVAPSDLGSGPGRDREP